MMYVTVPRDLRLRHRPDVLRMAWRPGHGCLGRASGGDATGNFGVNPMSAECIVFCDAHRHDRAFTPFVAEIDAQVLNLRKRQQK